MEKISLKQTLQYGNWFFLKATSCVTVFKIDFIVWKWDFNLIMPVDGFEFKIDFIVWKSWNPQLNSKRGSRV